MLKNVCFYIWSLFQPRKIVLNHFDCVRLNSKATIFLLLWVRWHFALSIMINKIKGSSMFSHIDVRSPFTTYFALCINLWGRLKNECAYGGHEKWASLEETNKYRERGTILFSSWFVQFQMVDIIRLHSIAVRSNNIYYHIQQFYHVSQLLHIYTTSTFAHPITLFKSITMVYETHNIPQNTPMYFPRSIWMWELSKNNTWIITSNITLLWIWIMLWHQLSFIEYFVDCGLLAMWSLTSTKLCSHWWLRTIKLLQWVQHRMKKCHILKELVT